MDLRSAEFEFVEVLGNFNAQHTKEVAGTLPPDNVRLSQFLLRQRYQLAVTRRTEVHTALTWLIDQHEDQDRRTEDRRYSLLLPFGRTHPTAPPVFSGEGWVCAALRYIVEEGEIAQGGLVYYVSHLHPPHGVEEAPELKRLTTLDGRQIRPVRGRTEQTPHEDRLPSEFPTTLASHIVSATVNEVHAGLGQMEMALNSLYRFLGDK